MSVLGERVASEAILARQAARESGARTYARTLPIVPVRAAGTQVVGADGRTYLDCLSGAGTLALGHNHPAVLHAIRDLVERGVPLHTLDIATPEKDAFTTVLLEALPPALAGDARIQFCGPTGADAVEAALKLVQTATGNRGLLAFTGAYHGMSAGAMAVSGGVAPRQSIAATAAEVTRLPYPYSYRCPFSIGGDQGAATAAEYVRRLLDDPEGGVIAPAGMIVEAVQGEGGVVPAPDDWMRAMREATAARGIPLIVDEVQTGVGRTGAMWAVDHSGVTPDVMVLSKAIGGGLPLAAIVYRSALDAWASGAHTGTFRGNQLAFVAGAATLRTVVEERLAERAATLGARLRRRLDALAGEHDAIGDVRGRGLMLGMEVVQRDAAPDPTGARPADTALAARVRAECLARGLIVELGGRGNAVVRLLPPLTITDDEADSAVERLAAAFAAAVR
jgi:diaminobutyrate-2-oxoglutarate transaminase